MKKLFIVLFIFTIMIGCRSYHVLVTNDEFTRSKSVKLDIWHKVTEGNLDNTRILYERSIKNGKTTPAVAKLEFRVVVGAFSGYGGENLDPYAYVLIGSKRFKVKLKDNKKTVQETVYGSGNTSATGSYSAHVGSYHSAYLRATIVFTPKMEQAIRDATSYKIRVSTAGNPTVMTANSTQLAKVKEFFAVRGGLDN